MTSAATDARRGWSDHRHGIGEFRDWLLELPGLVENARDRGNPISFPTYDLPAGGERRRATVELLAALGVELVEPEIVLGLRVPAEIIPDAFRARVELELRDARAGAFELLGQRDPALRPRRPDALPDEPLHAGARRYRKPCLACGGDLDRQTDGCRRCASRHAMRRTARRRREALELASSADPCNTPRR